MGGLNAAVQPNVPQTAASIQPHLLDESFLFWSVLSFIRCLDRPQYRAEEYLLDKWMGYLLLN